MGFFIRGRKSWATRTINPAHQTARSVHTLVVHHTVTPSPTDLAAVKVALRGIETAHVARDFEGIGYNVVIDRAGRVWEGRGIHAIGAGATGHNTGYFHVGFIGDYRYMHLTTRQKIAFAQLKLRLRLHGFRFKRVCGHNQLSGHESNACPANIRRDLGLG